ncbi:MAG: hypothetical protein HOP28_12100 [Gemmatimonadales bacterium]|nr:hypothetical protein [Gemmatimonadales bacterium]
MNFRTVAVGTVVGLLVIGGTGCAGRNRLSTYDFQRGSLAVVYDFPPHPEVLTGPYVPGHFRDPLHAIVRAGSQIVKEIEARQVRRRLDSAAVLLNVSSRVADGTGARAARYLGARLTDKEEGADFILDIQVRDYGIDAEEWDAAAHFFVVAEVVLLDGKDGRIIWETRVRDRDKITPAILGWHSVSRNIVTAAALADLSVDDLVRALTRLADYTADHVTRRLRDAVDDSRR